MQLADARHVLVTGAAGAIGGALAELLVKECPRARMTLVDKKPLPCSSQRQLSMENGEFFVRTPRLLRELTEPARFSPPRCLFSTA